MLGSSEEEEDEINQLLGLVEKKSHDDEFKSKVQTALEKKSTIFSFSNTVSSPYLLSSLQSLTFLQTLSLFCESYKSLRQYSFLEHLPLLEELVFSYYPLPELPPEVCKLTKLKKLCLYGSKLYCVPQEIGQLKNLVDFDPYTSYHLHWLPYEIEQCPIKSLRISTRSLYGKTLPYPQLPPSENVYRPLTDKYQTDLTLVSIVAVSIRERYKDDEAGLKQIMDTLPNDLKERLEFNKSWDIEEAIYLSKHRRQPTKKCSHCAGAFTHSGIAAWRDLKIHYQRIPTLAIVCSDSCRKQLKGSEPARVQDEYAIALRFNLWNVSVNNGELCRYR
eukprot:TRINITY_DN1773_c0_g3_i1.p1 TRINITY_DN1773_c0_g3~~TRINITY_DN1773_c0_g3_i1.p1  ORF type:complete len:353 (+),score=71.56 TRINITY_DN1773_c0_g3_i1:66-1061(+)